MESDLHSDLREWIADHLAADWTTVTQLRMEESKRDPPEEISLPVHRQGVAVR